jgi:hypothetical protein
MAPHLRNPEDEELMLRCVNLLLRLTTSPTRPPQ